MLPTCQGEGGVPNRMILVGTEVGLPPQLRKISVSLGKVERKRLLLTLFAEAALPNIFCGSGLKNREKMDLIVVCIKMYMYLN